MHPLALILDILIGTILGVFYTYYTSSAIARTFPKIKIFTRDYFFLFLNVLLPFVFMALEIIIKSSHQISLEFFWVVSTVSNAIGLLIGNLKPKPVELSAIDKNLLAQIKKKRKYKILLTNDKDESIIYQSYAFIFLFIGVWIYILNTTINTKLTLLKESFAFEALLAFVCYGIALNITYRKEKV